MGDVGPVLLILKEVSELFLNLKRSHKQDVPDPFHLLRRHKVAHVSHELLHAELWQQILYVLFQLLENHLVVLTVLEVEKRVDSEVSLKESHSQTPHVELMRKFHLFIEQDFRRQVEGSPDVALPNCPPLQTAEISDFVGLLHADDVFRLDISVDEVEVVDGHDALGGVQANVDELPEFDVGFKLYFSAERTGSELEHDVHPFVLQPR